MKIVRIIMWPERNGRFIAELPSGLRLKPSRNALTNACRYLASNGDGDAYFEVYHAGSSIRAMWNTVEEFARWFYTESDRDGIRCIPYREINIPKKPKVNLEEE